MTGKLQFRAATPADAPQLQPLIRNAYRGDITSKAWTTEG
ncbi:GNAT family N-acetyltransferase, partial [Candidatus Bathyarchaeota archaeon]|nr:GNAT family N-acetyltransferase [Candidatus Bathyarchaeota archaeon]